MSVTILNNKEFTTAGASSASANNCVQQMGQTYPISLQQSSESHYQASQQHLPQNYGIVNGLFVSNQKDTFNHQSVNTNTKRHYLNQTLASPSSSYDKSAIEKDDLEILRSCFHDVTPVAAEAREALIARIYRENNSDREAAFNQLSIMTKSRRINSYIATQSQQPSQNSNNKQPGQSSSQCVTTNSRKRTRDDVQRTSVEVEQSMLDQRNSINSSPQKHHDTQQQQKNPQQSDSKRILARQIIDELLKCGQSREQAENVIYQGLQWYESQQQKSSQTDEEKELMTWQNDILKKGIRSMQRISDEKIGQAQRIAQESQTQANQLQQEAQKQINEAERLQSEASIKMSKVCQLERQNDLLQRELDKLKFDIRNYLNQKIEQPHVQQFNNGSGFQGGPSLC